ncbi:MAG: thioredoxin domain-containing protein, partial [Balneolaceae bacterium]
EAFRRAKQEDKPIFLSIGYATCHWCHVMAHESFEDEEVARLMNDAFINIKVDREERPDIDNTYMTVCQMVTGHGGWPLTIVMTPDKEPFYAATYLPKESRPNRLGMLEFVPAIERAWTHDRDRIMESVKRIKSGFANTLNLGQSDTPLPDSLPGQTVQALEQRFDAVHGGFGGAPKFPSPHTLLFLMQHTHITGHNHARSMAEKTLLGMRMGGIWDHVGGGFHRYSTDPRWLLPHFEKMLYDQAMMLMAYVEGWQATGQELFRETAADIVRYVDECLTSPNGLFYSAEDADSEGEEGTFYVWTTDEIRTILGEDDGSFFIKQFNLEEEGNFRDESTGQKTGTNIPHRTELPDRERRPQLHTLLQQLKTEREKRERPLLDDKILTDWNGLMIAALARTGRLLDDQHYTEKACRAFDALLERVWSSGRLQHVASDGTNSIPGMADDYAFLIAAAIELHQTTLEPHYLNRALALQKAFDAHFWDDKAGGYYLTPDDGEALLGRQKEMYDGAIPSGNSVAAMNLFRLARLTGQSRFEEQSLRTLQAFSASLTDAPAGFTAAISAYQLHLHPPAEVVICAPKPSDETDQAVALCRSTLPPGSVILLKTAATADALSDVSSFTASFPVAEELTVYICREFTCRAPVRSLDALQKALAETW